MVAAGTITVAVRLRPPTAWEAGRLPEAIADTSFRCDSALSAPAVKSITSQTNLRHIVQIIDDRVLTFDPEEHDRSRAFVERGFLPPGTRRYKDRRFIFDRVFSHDTSQTDVYEGTSKPLLKNLLDGYNATIFAYGVSTTATSYPPLVPTYCCRRRDVERLIRSVAPTTTLVSSILLWRTCSGL